MAWWTLMIYWQSLVTGADLGGEDETSEQRVHDGRIAGGDAGGERRIGARAGRVDCGERAAGAQCVECADRRGHHRQFRSPCESSDRDKQQLSRLRQME